jgi:hypothetical protein
MRNTKGGVMITTEAVKEEYFRISKLLDKEALTGDDYNLNCKKGFSTHYIKRDLGLSYNQLKDKIGAKRASSANNKGGRNKKIYCSRGTGRMIGVKDCLVSPTSKDCQACPDKQLNNVQASSDTLTEEEERIARYEGVKGMGYFDMIAPYAEI